jgi:hypothetical protein
MLTVTQCHLLHTRMSVFAATVTQLYCCTSHYSAELRSQCGSIDIPFQTIPPVFLWYDGSLGSLAVQQAEPLMLLRLGDVKMQFARAWTRAGHSTSRF